MPQKSHAPAAGGAGRRSLVAVATLLAVAAATVLAEGSPADAKPRRTSKTQATTTTTASPTMSAPTVPGTTALALGVLPVDAWSAQLTWGTAPYGTARIVVQRGSRLIDVVSPEAAGYTDRLLWPATSYGYTVRFEQSDGTTAAQLSATVTTPVATTPVARFYGDGSFWNQRIPSGAAIAPASTAMVQGGLVAYASNANFANSDRWGIPLAYADPASATYEIGCTRWDCHLPLSGRIPAYARPTADATDQHLAVMDPAANREVDMYKATKDTTAGTWSAGSRYATDPSGWGAMCGLGERCNSANAAGFALMGGVVRPEEIAQGRIDHALVFTTPFTRKGVIACPATHTDGKFDDPAAIPEGARIQLDPAFDVDAQPWPRWKKVVAKALQEYGAYLGDTSGSVAIRGEASVNRGYDAWALAGVSSPSLSDLPWSSFRVLSYSTC